jgi:hypothetical protein
LLNVASDLVVTGNVGIGTSSPTAKLSVDGSVVFNESGADVDFRVEGDTDANLLFVDASTDRVGVGTNAPTHKFQASGSGRFGSMSTGAGLLSGSSDTFQVGLNQDNTNTTNTQVWAEYVNGASSASWAIRYRIANDTGTASTRLFLDAASGNLGLGVTPSAWSGVGAALQVGTSAAIIGNSANSSSFISNAYFDGTNYKYIGTGFAMRLALTSGVYAFQTAPSGTAGDPITFTDAMTLTAAGDLALGTTTADVFSIGFARNSTVSVTGAGTTAAVNISGGAASRLVLGVGSTRYGQIYQDATNFMEIGTTTSLPIKFVTDATERARITASGYFKASNTGVYNNVAGNYHELRTDVSNELTALMSNSGSSNPYGLKIEFTAASPNDAIRYFLACEDSTALRVTIRSNGGLANYQSNNADLSDERTKKDITPAPSYWDKIGALEIVTYKYNDQTHDDVNVGVIAQQVEAVEPVWVDSDGFGETPEGEEPLKTVYTKDITFAAIKALQEAMTRIEALEAEVAALKGAN